MRCTQVLWRPASRWKMFTFKKSLHKVELYITMFTFFNTYYHRCRSGWNSGGMHGEGRRWIGAEWGRVCGGVSPLQPARRSGERRELPQQGLGQRPGQKRILAFSEGHRTLIFLTLYDKICGGQFALSSPLLQILGGGTCPSVPPWSTPMPITQNAFSHSAYTWCSFKIISICLDAGL